MSKIEYRDALIEELNEYLYKRYSGGRITNTLTMEIESVLMQWSQFHHGSIPTYDYEINYDMDYPRVLLVGPGL